MQFKNLCSSYNHLKNINFQDIDTNQVSILIGTNNIDFVTSQATIKGPKNSTRAFCTPLAWFIVGSTADILGTTVFQAYIYHVNEINEDPELFELLATTPIIGNVRKPLRR